MNIPSKFLPLFLLASSLVLPVSAQVGDDNNTGTSGWFNGEVTTGCAYNAYTGSISRTVSDIQVSGAIGYPLAFTRTSTSRYTAGSKAAMEFGKPGNWLHSYSWSIDPYTGSHPGWPTKFVVNYPDGRRITFTNYSDAYVLPPPGVSGIIDLDPSATATSGHVWLWLPDGSKVQFAVAISQNRTKYSYTVESISDPYGQVTTISKSGAVTTVTEPAGRMLKIFFGSGPAGDNVITKVEEWMTATQKGRTVAYTYSLYTGGGAQYSALTSVSYLNVDGSTYATASYTYQNDNLSPSGRPLLSSCDDPMYSGPMRKIQYSYAPAGTNPDGSKVVSGQIQSEKSGTTGQAVSTLSWPSASPGPSPAARTETTGDGRTRAFNFTAGGLVGSYSDFRGKMISLNYQDGTGMPTNVVDRRGIGWNYSYNPYTRMMIGTVYPLTPNDTPPNTPQTGVSIDLGGINCPDQNNRDWYHAYFPYSITNQAAATVTVFLRDPNKRIIQVNYPDGGTETFTYNNFGQVLTHRLRTGGLETFEYDSRGLLTAYRDAYHLATADPQNPNVPTSATPNTQYGYDSLDRVSAVADASASGTTDLNHTTNYTYNWRGQVTMTTLPIDPIDNQRHSIVNAYNDVDGALRTVTDQLSHNTVYTYDDYKRIRSVTTPGHNTPLPSQLFYDANGTLDDYTHTDANVTYAKSPSGKKLITGYNENKQRISVTAMGANGEDPAMTTIGLDDNGNVVSVISPNEQPGQLYSGKSTVAAYDERNRPMSITDALNNPTTFMYDGAGRRASVTRANGQVTTFDSYDAMNRLLQQTMNRLLQQTVQQSPNPDAVTKYAYYTSGLLHTMQDPQLVANSSSYAYTYSYDLMGRKIGLNYPPDSGNAQRNELWHYDTNGRNDTFTNRNGNTQRILYDNLGRAYNVSWDDGGVTPTVTYGYDVASRLTNINNANATIARVLFNDGSLNTETTTYSDNTPRTVTYGYDSDGDRASIQYPNGAYSFNYSYTGRNQLWKILNGSSPVVTYGYDADGNLRSRSPDNSTSSTFTPDPLDRVTRITHALNGTTRTFDYAYDSVGNRKWTKRDGATGDVFGYDLNDQSISVLLNVANPDTTSPGAQTINYDANGNRTTFAAYGSTDTYQTNQLNQYTSRTSNGVTDSFGYDSKGNLTSSGSGKPSYTYDAQDRFLGVAGGVSHNSFAYDGLNRQVKHVTGGQFQHATYSVYDGWNLIAEYSAGSTSPSNAYLTGAAGVVKDLINNRYYYQDALGSTSNLADNSGALLESYRYDLQGTPIFYDASNAQISNTAYGVRHLFTGQFWYSDLGFYDLRHRFYSPDIGRFLQSDPISFDGDPTHLYRYCGNNALDYVDPFGLLQIQGQVTATGQIWRNLGLYITAGYSPTAQQWNAKMYIGGAFKYTATFNFKDPGLQKPGWSGDIIDTVAASTGYGLVGGRLTGTIGTEGVSLSWTVRGGPFSNGAMRRRYWGGIPTKTEVGESITFGGGAFVGIGGGYISRPASTATAPSAPSNTGPYSDTAQSASSNSSGSLQAANSNASDPAPSAAEVERLSLQATIPIDAPIYGENGTITGYEDANAIANFYGLGVTGESGGFGPGGAFFGGGGSFSLGNGGGVSGLGGGGSFKFDVHVFDPY